MNGELSSALPAWLERPTPSLRYLTYARAFAAGCIVHLTLEDAMQPGWLWPDLLCWLGVVLLAATGSVAGWALVAVGTAWPLLFLGDQLSQSVYMLLCAVSALVCFAGSRAGREERMAVSFPFAVRWLTALVYGLAALHKANTGFLDASVSCANAGIEVVARNWAAPWIATPLLREVWGPLYVVFEAALSIGFVVHPAAAVPFAFAEHVPLTIVFAPAFAFVTASGYVTFFSEDDLRHYARTMARRWPIVVGLGTALGVASFVLYMRHHWIVYGWWSFKEVLLWIGLVWSIAALWDRPPGVLRWLGAFRERPIARRGAILAILGLLVANALTPYLGLQFHHTAAMLSNLRIDRGCWNSVIFPESIRIVEPYVRIDEARVGDGEAIVEERLESLLWTPESLRVFRDDCRHYERPVRIRGTWRGRRFEVGDLCRVDDWPFGEGALPRFRGFQHNLTRECPQRCIH